MKIFEGRVSRSLFFLGTIAVGIITSISAISLQETNEAFYKILICIIIILLFILQLSLHARRWHDLGKNGYLSLLSLIPVVGTILDIFLIFKAGENKINKYGTQPPAFRF